ncbi:DNA helicase [Vibrio phage D69]
MKIVDCNQHFFQIVPENATESNKLRKFPGFRLIKGKYYIPKKPEVVQNLIYRFKKVHKDPINACDSFRDYMTSTSELLTIPEDFPWINTPYPHQELALRFLYTHGSAGLLLEPGLGKTFVVLNYIRLMNFQKSLIVCPKALLFVWEDEVAEHRPDLTVHVMQSTSWSDKLVNAEARLHKWKGVFEAFSEAPEDEEGLKAYNRAKLNMKTAERELRKLPELMKVDMDAAEAADIVVVNYEKVAPGLKTLMDMKFDFISIDEGLMKSMQTTRTKALHKLGSSIGYRCIMSGTLINNGPLDAFSPIKFLEPALSGGAYGAFEHHYARIAKTRNGRRFVAGVGKRQTEEIRDTLAACSIVMTKDEWLDLPDKHFHRITVPMSDAQRGMYDDLSANHICEVGDGKYIEVENPLTVACYLNQIANGFVYHYGGEPEDDFADLFDDFEEQERGPRETLYIDSGKKQALRELVEENLNNKKFILWYNLQAEYEQIKEVLDGLEMEWRSIRGGSKDTGGTVHEFNSSGSIQVLVCQSQSVNYGITVLGRDPEALEAAGVEVMPDFDTSVYNHVFWSLGWSLERYTQQQDRSHRIGQRQDVHYWILATECGIEDLVWERLDLKEDIRDAILVDYIKSISH